MIWDLKSGQYIVLMNWLVLTSFTKNCIQYEFSKFKDDMKIDHLRGSLLFDYNCLNFCDRIMILVLNYRK